MVGMSSSSAQPGGVTDQAADKAAGAAEQGGQKAAQAVQQTGQKAAEAVGSAKETAQQRIDDGMTQAGERVGHFVTALRRSATSLEEEGDQPAAKGAHQIADRVDRLSSYLTANDGNRLLQDTSQQVRRRPWLFAAGGLALGLAAARVVRTAAETAIEHGGSSSSGSIGAPQQGFQQAPLGSSAAITGPGEGQLTEPYATAAVSRDV